MSCSPASVIGFAFWFPPPLSLRAGSSSLLTTPFRPPLLLTAGLSTFLGGLNFSRAVDNVPCFNMLSNSSLEISVGRTSHAMKAQSRHCCSADL